jgi:PHD/YefM family antitoxin component YafN of YafNO toxin-antitoxin module
MRHTEAADVVTVRDARTNLSRILSSLHDAGPQAEPVFIGAHRKPEGVLLSVESFRELMALRERFERGEAVASAWGSLGAEGLKPTAQFVDDANDFTSGQIDADELARRAVARHRR